MCFALEDYTTEWQQLESRIAIACTISPILLVIAFEIILSGAMQVVGGIKLPSGKRLPPVKSYMDEVTLILDFSFFYVQQGSLSASMSWSHGQEWKQSKILEECLKTRTPLSLEESLFHSWLKKHSEAWGGSTLQTCPTDRWGSLQRVWQRLIQANCRGSTKCGAFEIHQSRIQAREGAPPTGAEGVRCSHKKCESPHPHRPWVEGASQGRQCHLHPATPRGNGFSPDRSSWLSLGSTSTVLVKSHQEAVEDHGGGWSHQDRAGALIQKASYIRHSLLHAINQLPFQIRCLRGQPAR